MSKPYQHLEAVIFDWAGTIVDFGSFAPTQVLLDVFSSVGVPITLEEARVPMGLAKWDHIQALGRLPGVAARWRDKFGDAMRDADVDRLYRQFMPLQVARVGAYSQLIPGALDAVATLRGRGLKIGSCSGYPRVVMDALLPLAAAAGYTPDHTVATDDLRPGGRPGPWMALANVIELGVRDVRHCVKVDDTVPGIEEGLRAGMWTVGLAASGNAVGLSAAQWQALDDAAREQHRAPAVAELQAAGAHYVIDTVGELPAILDLIDARLQRGEQP